MRALILLLGAITVASSAESSAPSPLELLSRQLVMQQLSIEERIRGDDDSGLKNMRLVTTGTKNYLSNTITGNKIAAIHDHSNYDRTVGMGEFSALLNGVEFRTRHNDYKLVMPSQTSDKFHATEPIPFPEVPPEVLSKKTVDEQIEEMREWFRAWKDGNSTHRPYEKYFKATICYLEGAWTTSGSSVDESFQSDRHNIDAKSWLELADKIRFTAYSGRKSQLENFAFLPTTIMDVGPNGEPNVAQWNYRILCAPVKQNILTNRLRVRDDLTSRLAYRRSMEEQKLSRAARFQVNPFDKPWSEMYTEKQVAYGLLDDIMANIPGKDNFKADLVDEVQGVPISKLDNSPLNVGYYHRWYKSLGRDAMGTQKRKRGFSDSTVFMAMNTQPNIAPMNYTSCFKVKGERRKTCSTLTQRWSYAIPLELIYLTPLYTWNPYNFTVESIKNSFSVTQGKGTRKGGLTADKAYNGVSKKLYYLTPSEFYAGGKVKKEAADTVRNSVGVLDQEGIVRSTSASGTKITLPPISGLGTLRTRYPIMPITYEGNYIMKELEALKDIVLESVTNAKFYRQRPAGLKASDLNAGQTITLELGNSRKTPPDPHSHTFEVSSTDIERMIQSGRTRSYRTTSEFGHSHRVTIKFDRDSGNFHILKCDNRPECWDEHPTTITIDPEQISKETTMPMALYTKMDKADSCPIDEDCEEE